VVYTSEALSLAALELLVHLASDDLPGDLVAIPADIPDAVASHEIETTQLPADWRAFPAPEALVAMGTRWAEERRTAVLAVPSAVIPVEGNVILNPFHPDFRKIRVGKPAPFAGRQAVEISRAVRTKR